MPDPQPEKNAMKEQRDRFLAFSFASADLFLEISQEGRVTFAIGAAKSLTGVDPVKLMGMKWLEMFSVYEQAKLIQISETAKPGIRKGPMLINLSDSLGARKAIMNAIRMPDNPSLYLSLGLSSAVMARIAHAMGDGTGFEILGKEEFEGAAINALARSRAGGQDMCLTLIDFAPTGMDRKRMGEPAWKKIRENLAEYLIAECVDGYSAAEIGDGRYCVVYDSKMNHENFREKVSNICKQADPAGEGVAILKIKPLPADLKKLTEKQTQQAVKYVLDEFQVKGADIPVNSLPDAHHLFATANQPKMKEFLGFIERSAFNTHFQPVVEVASGQAKFYEMLARFESGDALSWIKFGEDMGLAVQFDTAMLDRAINHVKFKAGNTWTKFSVNLSRLSVENDGFRSYALEKLGKDKILAERLMFEITGGPHIADLYQAGAFIGTLKSLGFTVALDDFCDWSGVSEFLIKLQPDHIKIDGRHVRGALSSTRDQASVRNLVLAAKGMGIQAIAKHVEDKATASLMKEAGVHYLQGFYYGRPAAKPDYVPPRD